MFVLFNSEVNCFFNYFNWLEQFVNLIDMFVNKSTWSFSYNYLSFFTWTCMNLQIIRDCEFKFGYFIFNKTSTVICPNVSIVIWLVILSLPLTNYNYHFHHWNYCTIELGICSGYEAHSLDMKRISWNNLWMLKYMKWRKSWRK